MKKSKLFVIGILITAVICAVTVYAATYDSSNDPLVTLSYLTEIFKPQLRDELETALNQAVKDIEGLAASGIKIPDGSSTTTPVAPPVETPDNKETDDVNEESTANFAYEVLFLTRGTTVLAENACEMILRAGIVQVVSPFSDQGIADLTSATDLLNGTEVENNHLLLVPRGGDGRGLVVTSDSAYIMVRGEYSIVEPEE